MFLKCESIGGVDLGITWNLSFLIFFENKKEFQKYGRNIISLSLKNVLGPLMDTVFNKGPIETSDAGLIL